MNEILTHDIKLLGLKMPNGDEMASYFDELPVHFTKCDSFRKLYRLKKRKRNESKDNLEIYEGLDVIIHDPYAKKYFYRTLKHYTDMNKMLKYYKDGNLYILKEEYQVKEEPEDDEIPELGPKKDLVKPIVDNDEEALIF
jgi:hypothetical protein